MKLLGLCGKPRAGKNVVAGMVAEMVPGTVILNFSEAIIAECARVLQVPESVIEADKEHYRPFMQWYGFDHKRREDAAYWVKRIEQRVEEAREGGARMAVFCGVRALNEWEMIIRHSGAVYEVVRGVEEWSPSARPPSGSPPFPSAASMDHPCEKQRIPVSGRIKNLGSLEDLRNRVRRVVKRIMEERNPASIPAISTT